ncbi:MAG: TonB-dependent receptor [Bacteroidia bacterium]|nr:TonB dependent receptor [Bacteroidia bacterium]MDW8133694.1 TonB-dependent receptor [Bacteroidia bacterium]
MKRGAWIVMGSVLSLWAQSLRIEDEEGNPVKQVSVRLTPLNTAKPLLVQTDSTGSIEVPPGIYYIEVRAEGFLPLKVQANLPTTFPLRLKKPSYQISEDIVITGHYAPIAEMRSLYPIRILTSERLRAQGALYLPQVLMTELNTRLSQDPNLGTFATLQGLGGEHIKILIDGIPVIGRVSGSIDLNQLPLAEVERVEIVEGPMSVLYGTDAMGGVINLITRSKRCQWESRGHFQYEATGIYDLSFSLTGGPQKHRLSLTGGRYYFQGWDPNPSRPRARLWRPREQYNGLLVYQFSPSERFLLRLQMPVGDETFFNLKEPTFTPYRIYALDEYYYTRRIMPTLNTTYTLSKRLRWDIQGAVPYYRRIRKVVYKDLVTLEETPIPLEGQQDTTEEYHIWSRGALSYKGERMFLQLGHEVDHTFLQGGRIRGGRTEMGDYALWATAEWRLAPELSLRPGFRWTYNTRYSAPFLPAFHIRWEITPNLAWRIGYTRGFRSPSLREQFLYLVFTNHNIQGNPTLRPEQGHHFHTNLTWNHLRPRTLWRLRLSAFYNQIEDVIQLVIVEPATLLTTYLNLHRLQTLGLQPRLEMLKEGASFLVGSNFINYSGERWGWEIVIQGNLTWKGFSFHSFFKYQGRTPIFLGTPQGEISWRWIGNFPWLDLSVGRAFWKSQLFLVGGLRNAFGITNVQSNLTGGIHTGAGVSSPVGMGRYFFTRIEYHFQKGQL